MRKTRFATLPGTVARCNKPKTKSHCPRVWKPPSDLLFAPSRAVGAGCFFPATTEQHTRKRTRKRSYPPRVRTVPNAGSTFTEPAASSDGCFWMMMLSEGKRSVTHERAAGFSTRCSAESTQHRFGVLCFPFLFVVPNVLCVVCCFALISFILFGRSLTYVGLAYVLRGGKPFCTALDLPRVSGQQGTTTTKKGNKWPANNNNGPSKRCA